MKSRSNGGRSENKNKITMGCSCTDPVKNKIKVIPVTGRGGP
jgi:hypothetical protein